MTKDKSQVLLFSGGMDSYIAWYYLNRPYCFYCDLGHRYARVEREKIDRSIKSVGMYCRIEARLNLSDWEEPDANIPMRNLFLAALAAKDPKVSLIWLISQKGETSIPDRSPTFMDSASHLLTWLNGRSISIRSPFMNMTKMDMVGWYIKMQDLADPKCSQLMDNTVGCYNPVDDGIEGIIHCGQCAACFRRFIAFRYNGIDNSSEYSRDILTWEGTRTYYKKFIKMASEKDWGNYGKKRVEQSLEVLRAVC